MTTTLKIVPGDTVAISVTGALFEKAFDEPFGTAAVTDLTKSPATWSFVAFASTANADEPAGFVIGMTVCDTAEIYSIGVVPGHREQGFARALMEKAHRVCARNGAESMFLEVAADNSAAIALYSGLGYIQNGRRKNYYRRGREYVDAVMMAKKL